MIDIPMLALMIFAYAIALIFLLSGIDDFIIDSIYWIWARKKKNMLKIEDLLAKEEKRIAVVVAAWKEEDVIDKMIVNAIKMIDYKDYDIFVGIYPNDQETKKSILSLEDHYFNKVYIIVNDVDGPTNKGQNLNMIFKGIKKYEEQSGKKYEIVLMQDSEDIIHPLSLKLFNYLMPQKSMVQIPVFPIEPEMNLKNYFKYMISSTYADEFAENHTKDIIVRKQIKGIIPSAGVGTAFARDALDKIASKNNGNVFNYNNVTEDYEVAIRFHEAKLETDYYAEGLLGLDDKGKRKIEYIATREFFPNTFRAAVKQKSRWVYGITFQTPSQHSLKNKTFAQVYSLLRDRKARYVNMVNLPAYFLFIYSIFDLVYSLITGQPPTLATKIFPIFSIMWFVIVADTGLAVFRAINRFIAIKEVYGKKNASFSVLIPPILSLRLIYGNVINFFSTLDAWKTFIFGNKRKVKWNKTVHKEYAPEEVLREYKRKLGDILLENRIIDEKDLSDAIKNKICYGRLLGKCLVDIKMIEKKEMDLARAMQLRSYPAEIRTEDLDIDLIEKIPEAIAKIGKLLVIGKLKHSVLVAKAEGMPESFTEIIREKIGQNIEYVSMDEKILMSFIDMAYNMTDERSREERKFGNLLVREEIISEEMLAIALNLQKNTNYKIGKALLKMGYITEEKLAKNLAKYFGLEYKDLSLGEINIDIAILFPKSIALQYGMLPFEKKDDKILLALSDPLENHGIEEVRKIYAKEIKPYECTKTKIVLAASKIHEERLEAKYLSMHKTH